VLGEIRRVDVRQSAGDDPAMDQPERFLEVLRSVLA
jgi:hypothetical protein